MHGEAVLTNLFRVHKKYGVPLQLSVQLVCKWKNIGVAELTEAGGYHRNYLSATLRGVQIPSRAFRAHVRSVLGIDPWAFVSGNE